MSVSSDRLKNMPERILPGGQALGLSFGLGHSCAAYPRDPRCRISLMQEGKPPGAMLLQPEIEKLEQSPFFTRR